MLSLAVPALGDERAALSPTVSSFEGTPEEAALDDEHVEESLAKGFVQIKHGQGNYLQDPHGAHLYDQRDRREKRGRSGYCFNTQFQKYPPVSCPCVAATCKRSWWGCLFGANGRSCKKYPRDGASWMQMQGHRWCWVNCETPSPRWRVPGLWSWTRPQWYCRETNNPSKRVTHFAFVDGWSPPWTEYRIIKNEEQFCTKYTGVLPTPAPTPPPCKDSTHKWKAKHSPTWHTCAGIRKKHGWVVGRRDKLSMCSYC